MTFSEIKTKLDTCAADTRQWKAIEAMQQGNGVIL